MRSHLKGGKFSLPLPSKLHIPEPKVYPGGLQALRPTSAHSLARARHTCASVEQAWLQSHLAHCLIKPYPALCPCRGKAVCAALLRIFGRHLAEVPLVATRTAARRQGHCRVLMTAIERMLQTLNVGVLSLPAAQTAISTWVNAFEFRPMQALELQAVQSELRVLTFPGSQVSGDAEPGGGWAGRQREGLKVETRPLSWLVDRTFAVAPLPCAARPVSKR